MTTTIWKFNTPLSTNKLSLLLARCKQHHLEAKVIDAHHVSIKGDSKNTPNIVKMFNPTIIGANNQKHRNYLKQRATAHVNATSFSPLQLAEVYNFPPNLNGANQTIGVIELGGGFVLSDVTTFLTNLGIETTPNITAVGVDGATNDPSDTSGANLEVILDIEVIVALAPAAEIRVYFSTNTSAGFYQAILTAINDGCKIISISWGGPESSWDQSDLTSFNSLFQTATSQGVTIFVAAGDNGSSDGSSGNNVDFPGSSPYAVSCGGTYLTVNNNTRSSEVVWDDSSVSSATGGGISKVFAKPSYQNNVAFNLGNFRGVPDIAANADPNSGYNIYYQGAYTVVGGTSAVAPLYSALFARINQSLATTTAGFIHPTIYNNIQCFYDITQGNNGAYSAGIHWDCCSGNGVGNGQLLLNLFTAPTGQIGPTGPTGPTGPAPTAAFTDVVSNLTVTLTNTSTNAISYSWNFGDTEGTSTLISPTHTYAAAGTYTITLVATNSNGSNSVSHSVTVTAAPVAPVASFTNVVSNLTVTLTNTSTNATSYSWNFGDTEGTSTLVNPTHTYAVAGTYTITLVATGTGSNRVSHNVTVTAPAVPVTPVASFTTAISNLTVILTNTSTHATSYSWNFGDNTGTSTLVSPTHTYVAAGTYTITLVATGTGSNSVSHNVTVVNSQSVLPVANFTASPISGNVPLTVNFTNTSTNATSYMWHMGAGAVFTTNPTYTFTRPGKYTIALTAINVQGSNTVTKSNYINVIAIPVHASFNFVISGNTVTFENTSTGNPTNYFWLFGDGQTSVLANPTHTYQHRGSHTVVLKSIKSGQVSVYSASLTT